MRPAATTAPGARRTAAFRWGSTETDDVGKRTDVGARLAATTAVLSHPSPFDEGHGLKVIVFDPADEERMQEWMTRGSRKEIIHQTHYLTSVGGTERQVVVAPYVEERSPFPASAPDASYSGRPSAVR